MSKILEAGLTWTGDRFETGVQIAMGEDGRIEAVGDLAGRRTSVSPAAPFCPAS